MRSHIVVGVDPSDELAAGGTEAHVSGACHAAVRLVDNRDAVVGGRPSVANRGRVVGRAIVDDNHL